MTPLLHPNDSLEGVTRPEPSLAEKTPDQNLEFDSRQPNDRRSDPSGTPEVGKRLEYWANLSAKKAGG